MEEFDLQHNKKITMSLNFYDILYYSIYKFYAKYKKDSAESTAAGIVGGLQAANVLTVLMIISIYLRNKEVFNKLIIILLFIVFQVVTYVRYIFKENNSVNIIEGKWLSKSQLWQNKKKMYIGIYIFLSIIFLLGVAMYLGTVKF